MAVYSYKTYTGDGATTTFAPTIDYLEESHIKVYVDDVLQTDPADYSWSANQIVFTSPPASAAEILIQRVTPRAWASRGVDYSVQTFLDKGTLDLNQQWVWYIMQEAHETDDSGKITPSGAEYIRWNSVRLEWDARRSGADQKMGGLADPAADDDAATKGYVDSIAEFGVGGVPQVYNLTGDGVSNTFSLLNGSNVEAEMCVVALENGSGDLIYQQPLIDYTVVKKDPSSDLVFTSIPAAGRTISVSLFGRQRFVGSALADASVTTAKLADGAVTTAKLADDSVTNAKIDASAVGTIEIAPLAVTKAEVAADAIDLSKIDDSNFTTAPGGGTDQALLVNEGSGALVQRVLTTADLPDIATWLAAQGINQLGAATASVDMGSQKIVNLADPTALQEAATKNYVDSIGSTNQSKIVRQFNGTLGAAAATWDFSGFTLSSGYLWYDLQFTNFQANLTTASHEVYLRYKIGTTWYEDKIHQLIGLNAIPQFASALNPKNFRIRISEHAASGSRMSMSVGGELADFTINVANTGTVIELGLRIAGGPIMNTGMRMQAYGGEV